MNTSQPVEAELLPPSNAVAVREPEVALPVAVPAAKPMTSEQAKVDAIASLTMSAYERASTLALTDGEIAALAAEFPDDAFKSGAAGKEHLIYIEHAFLRDRLNSVFRPGQWSIIPRKRWAEDFKSPKGTPGSRVYVEAMLVIRGCFVSEAIGEMEYYPSNASQNFGDAVEGAKTAALRRCCKELGVGLQAWKKDWCEGWWQRKRGHPDPARRSAPAPAPAPAKPAPAPVPAAKPNGTATAAHRERMVKLLAGKDNAVRQVATEFMQKIAWLMPNEALEDLPLQYVPTSKEDMDKLTFSIQMFAGGQAAVKPYEAHVMPLAPKTAAKPAAAAKPIEVPRDNKPAGEVPDEWFMKVVCPVPHAGEKRDEYLKHPDTIGSLYAARHDNEEARKRLFGFAYNYQPKGWTKRDGTEMPPNEADIHFRDALDAFSKWFEENHPDEVSDS